MDRHIYYWHFIAIAFLGGIFGLQNLYTKRYLRFILSLLFFWTAIPALIATVEGFVWLFRDEENFTNKFNKKF